MSTVYCVKMKKNLPALARAPLPGELGRKILQNVSQEGWRLWLEHQTMLINENHLSMMEPAAQVFLKEQMEKFFFSQEGADKIAGYVPENK